MYQSHGFAKKMWPGTYAVNLPTSMALDKMIQLETGHSIECITHAGD